MGHVEAFEKTEDIYAEYVSRDATSSSSGKFPKFSYKQEDDVSMRYDDAPVFHLDTEWLLQLDRSARNKKEIASLKNILGKTTTELAELKAMFQKLLVYLPQLPASQGSAIVRPSAPQLGEDDHDTTPTSSQSSRLSLNSQPEGFPMHATAPSDSRDWVANSLCSDPVYSPP